MSDWSLIACLVALRNEFNAISPNRDKGADGSIGDSAHTSRSDHTPDEDSSYLRDHDSDSKNEVHALDIDSSGPWPGTGTQKQRFHRIIMRILAAELKKWKDPNDKCRLKYVIWDRHIYERDNDFEPREYTLSDPHTNHAHFSGRYETACEIDTRPWEVADEEEDVDDATILKIANKTADILEARMVNGATLEERVGAAPLNYNGGGLPGGLPANGGKPANFLNYFTDLYRKVQELMERVPDPTPAQRVDKVK